ncbi:MAG: patatin-like phospholipase family protein [Gammaproteobacteria bacterium]
MPYKNLVFQGGGSAGVAYIGAIKKLEALESEDKFSFKKLQRVGGASVGAIMALLIALDYKADEIYTRIGNLNFSSLQDDRFGIVGDIVRLDENYGIYNSDLLLKLLQNFIFEKTGNKDATFGDFRRLGFKDLYVVTTKVFIRDGDGTCETAVFSPENAFDTSVAHTVLASASFPGVFECARLDEIGPGKYQFIKSKRAHAYIDGGVLDNIPEELFDKERFITDQKESKEITKFNPETLGLRLVNKSVIADLTEHKETITPIPSGAPLTYLSALVNGCTSGQQETLFRKNHDVTRSILIDRLGVSATAVIGKKMTMQLLASGDTAVSEFFGVTPTPKETTESLAKAFDEKRVPNGSLYTKKPVTADPEVSDQFLCPHMCVML